MRRYLFALTCAAVAGACFDLSSPVPSTLSLAPILDSLFVGDTAPARTAVYSANGNSQPPGPVTWSISPTSVATIDAVTGKIVGVSKGPAVVTASVATVSQPAVALVFVSRPVDLSLLMDTLILAPGDTISLPAYLAQKLKNPAATTLRFDSSPAPSVYTIDTTTGLVTAKAVGGPIRYVARLTAGATTVADTGGVVVLGLVDTTGSGVYYMTASGTGIRHQKGAALGINYTRFNLHQAFELLDTLARSSPDTVNDQVVVTLPDSVIALGTHAIDSLGLQEASSTISQLNPFCNPRRPWAAWLSFQPYPGVYAYSHGTPSDSVAGSLAITQYTAGATGGAIISGRYVFMAQRTDLYANPLGAETIRGTFVAPLRTRPNAHGCQG